ncbi:MAG: TraR/DksA family transcriptional regulator [Planctomycetota bacterium]
MAKKKPVKKAKPKKKAAKAKAKKKPVKKAKAKPKPKKKTAAKTKSKAKTKKKTAAKAKSKAKAAKKTRKKFVPPPPLKGVKTPLVSIITEGGQVVVPEAPPKPKRARKLKPAQVFEIRGLLLTRREELLKEISEEIDQSRQGAKQRSADPTDQASDSADGDLALALAQSDTDELNQIEAALARLEAGEIGSCEECSAPIPMERLRALPYATTCIECKRRRELRSGSDSLDEAWEAVHNSEEERGGEDD